MIIVFCGVIQTIETRRQTRDIAVLTLDIDFDDEWVAMRQQKKVYLSFRVLRFNGRQPESR